MAERKVLYSWRPEGISNQDSMMLGISDEYRVVHLDEREARGDPPMACVRTIAKDSEGGWVLPWDSDPLVWHLLTKLQEAETELARLREVERLASNLRSKQGWLSEVKRSFRTGFATKDDVQAGTSAVQEAQDKLFAALPEDDASRRLALFAALGKEAE